MATIDAEVQTLNIPLIGAGTFLVACLVTVLTTPLVVRLARALGAEDLPSARKMHSEPIPRIGGVAVFIGFTTAMIFAAAVTGHLLRVPSVGVQWRGLALAAAFMFLVGLADDLWQVSFRLKLAACTAMAVYVWVCGFRIDLVTSPLGGSIEMGLFSLPLTILWIVGITNAVNLIDGLDGLAAGTASIMTVAIAAFSFVRGDLGITASSVALAGSLIGFLFFNFNPARIFLGDSGSLFVGFVLAVTAAREGQKGPATVAVFIPLLVMGLPLLDTSYAVVRRSIRLGSSSLRPGRGLPYLVRNLDHIFLPDKEHIHHRLLEFGLSHRNAVLVLYGVVSLMVLAASALVFFKGGWLPLLLVGVILLLCLLFLGLVHRQSRQNLESESSAEPVAPGAEESVGRR